MSYIRGHDWAVEREDQGDDFEDTISFPDSQVSLGIFDMVVVMRYAELVTEGKLEETQQRALQNCSGNVGCCALEKLLGLPDGFNTQFVEALHEFQESDLGKMIKQHHKEESK